MDRQRIIERIEQIERFIDIAQSFIRRWTPLLILVALFILGANVYDPSWWILTGSRLVILVDYAKTNPIL